MDKNNISQAVVIIHGIGEQKPMETLRRFADAVLPEVEDGQKFFSKPDRLSESFELRKLQNRGRPKTHFYEYYWAYKVDGSSFGHVFSWLAALLLRKPSNVPQHLRAFFYLSWLLIAVAVVFGVLGISDKVNQLTEGVSPFVVSLFSAALFALVQLVVLDYVGDAARYLSPRRQNIKLRHDIRTDGIKLLRSLQESGEYDRIIVVGHSLGSVIAYDILTHLWQECNAEYKTPKQLKQACLSGAEKAGLALDRAQDESVKAYHAAQQELWGELRTLGNPWLVTDLITLGSPLAHAALLLAESPGDLQSRQQQRELPTSPPVYEIEKKTGNQYFSYAWDPYGDDIRLRVVHHAGLFGCTRWTNLYFPCKWGLFGDLVGGPLQPWFGSGIRDVAVRSAGWLRTYTLEAHVSYWRREKTAAQAQAGALPLALDALIEALDLRTEQTTGLQDLPVVRSLAVDGTEIGEAGVDV